MVSLLLLALFAFLALGVVALAVGLLFWRR